MTRDWNAEQHQLDREMADSRRKLDATFRDAAPGINQKGYADPANLKAYGEARAHHEAVKAKRTAFLIERARHERRP